MENEQNKLIRKFKAARGLLKKTVNRFPSKRREEILFDKWSLKDVVAHISGWDHYTINLLKNFKAGVETTWGLSVNKYNEQEVKKRKGWSWDKVYSEFVALGKELEQEYSSLSVDLFEQRFWKNKKYTPREFINTDIEHYLKEHIPEINKFILINIKKEKNSASNSDLLATLYSLVK